MRATRLRREVSEQVERLKNADILVGIPSFNNAGTIGHVVRSVQAGLATYFPGFKAVLVNADGGSHDGTMELARNAHLIRGPGSAPAPEGDAIPVIATAYQGIPGKGTALATVFELATALHAKACAVVDSDLRSITPEWMQLLLSPILDGSTDFVAPLYRRHKFDGTITNSIAYPFTRALYGRQVRQPIGGDVGFSGELAAFYAAQDVWQSEVARFGIDIWMTTTALASHLRVSQAFLGAKVHDGKDPGVDLSAMLSQVVGAMFALTETYAPQWRMPRASVPVPTYGRPLTVGVEPVTVNTDRMLGIFREGCGALQGVWREILGPGDLDVVLALARVPPESFHVPPDTWARLLYDFALAYHERRLPRGHIIGSLTPLYLAQTASFINEVRDLDHHGAEQVVETLCLKFEENKPYLVANWR